MSAEPAEPTASPLPPGESAVAVAGRRLTGQLLRFGAIGVASTLAYSLLYLALRPLTGAFAANTLALLLTALGNTAANRRLTFGVRGAGGLAGDHAAGLVALGLGLALTNGSLAGLHLLSPASPRRVEFVVLTLANVAATVLRFLVLRLRLHRPGGATPRRRGLAGELR